MAAADVNLVCSLEGQETEAAVALAGGHLQSLGFHRITSYTSLSLLGVWL